MVNYARTVAKALRVRPREQPKNERAEENFATCCLDATVLPTKIRFSGRFSCPLTLRFGPLTREGLEYPSTAAAWPQCSLHHSATARYLTCAQLSWDQWDGAHCCVRVICCLPVRCLPVATSEVPPAPVARSIQRLVVRSASSALRLRHARRAQSHTLEFDKTQYTSLASRRLSKERQTTVRVSSALETIFRGPT
jgi:hypothetical protein